VSERTASGGFVTSGRGEARWERRILSLSAVIFNSMPQFFSATQSSSRRNDSFARVKEAENQTTASRTTFDAEVRRVDAVAPSQKSDGASKNRSILHNRIMYIQECPK
jgi:hypothetical protein